MTDTIDRVITIDADRAIELLELAVAERGEDYVYQRHFMSCQYFAAPARQGIGASCPACLIGLALHHGGVSAYRLSELHGAIADLAGYDCDIPNHIVEGFATGALGTRHHDSLAAVGIKLTESAAWIWQGAQCKQDAAETWGQALAFARQVRALVSTP